MLGPGLRGARRSPRHDRHEPQARHGRDQGRMKVPARQPVANQADAYGRVLGAAVVTKCLHSLT